MGVARLGEGLVFGKVRDVLVFVWEIGQCLDGSGRVTDTPHHVLPHSLTSPSPSDTPAQPAASIPKSPPPHHQILQPNLQFPDLPLTKVRGGSDTPAQPAASIPKSNQVKN